MGNRDVGDGANEWATSTRLGPQGCGVGPPPRDERAFRLLREVLDLDGPGQLKIARPRSWCAGVGYFSGKASQEVRSESATPSPIRSRVRSTWLNSRRCVGRDSFALDEQTLGRVVLVSNQASRRGGAQDGVPSDTAPIKKVDMVKFARKKQQPNVTAPVATLSDTPDTFTAEGGLGYSRDPKSELFVLAVTNMVGEATFYESSRDRDRRFSTLVAQVAAADPDWIARFVPFLRDTMQLRSASVVMAAAFARARSAKPAGTMADAMGA